MLPGILRRSWWVEHRELQAKLSRQPDNPADVSGHTLAVAHSLAVVGGAAGGAGGEQPVFQLDSDNDEDIKPAVKTEGGGAGSSSGGGRYGNGRRGGGCERNGGY
jgi:hypothetical protein